MRLFVKFLILICCLGFYPCRAEVPDKTEVNAIKEYKEYFDDYAKRLYENYKPEKRFFFGQGEFIYFFINRDGTIEHLDTFFSNNRFSRYCKKIIRNTPAYPFPEQIKDDKIFVYMDMIYLNENIYYIDLCGRTEVYRSVFWKPYYNKPSINIVDISIEKENKKFSKNDERKQTTSK